MLSRIAITTLHKMGAQSIDDLDKFDDPTTEEEFRKITYRPTDVELSWTSYLAEYENQLNKTKKRILRTCRDLLLGKTDWIMQPDVINTIANKDDWLAYRQALRDLPETITEYFWIGNYDDLDLRRMNIPQPPPVIRI